MRRRLVVTGKFVPVTGTSGTLEIMAGEMLMVRQRAGLELSRAAVGASDTDQQHPDGND
jgi:hypothetical protein